ncbi:hypothetical protein LTR37_003390 [Vermiconidia calcicola]|uniref:Uncharacterized protein n=1 Tax=Vermiconidia calcicola TaxID=1690605 RepID=A0ACC3NR76_9PEZI|nr:hypothetical protein LTR37_003390 [Vermiconidia calcicola]
MAAEGSIEGPDEITPLLAHGIPAPQAKTKQRRESELAVEQTWNTFLEGAKSLPEERHDSAGFLSRLLREEWNWDDAGRRKAYAAASYALDVKICQNLIVMDQRRAFAKSKRRVSLPGRLEFIRENEICSDPKSAVGVSKRPPGDISAIALSRKPADHGAPPASLNSASNVQRGQKRHRSTSPVTHRAARKGRLTSSRSPRRMRNKAWRDGDLGKNEARYLKFEGKRRAAQTRWRVRTPFINSCNLDRLPVVVLADSPDAATLCGWVAAGVAYM